MKKLMYLAITFFTFIFSFIAPIKNNFNINNNNNKIVEKLDPKRVFENAPLKTNNLPSVNQEFKLFFNINSVNDINEFLTPLFNSIEISEIPTILFVGQFDNNTYVLTTVKQEVDIYDNGVLDLIMINLTTTDFTDFEPFFTFSYAKDSNMETPFITFNGVDISINNEENNNIVNTLFNTINEEFNTKLLLSLESYEDINVNTTILNGSNYIYGYDVVSNSPVPGLIGVISSIANGLLSLLISLFSSVVAIFWNVSNNTPTFLGVVLLFVVAVPITYWVINFVIGLIRKIRLTRGK